jgi:hypothetical protein
VAEGLMRLQLLQMPVVLALLFLLAEPEKLLRMLLLVCLGLLLGLLLEVLLLVILMLALLFLPLVFLPLVLLPLVLLPLVLLPLVLLPLVLLLFVLLLFVLLLFVLLPLVLLLRQQQPVLVLFALLLEVLVVLLLKLNGGAWVPVSHRLGQRRLERQVRRIAGLERAVQVDRLARRRGRGCVQLWL